MIKFFRYMIIFFDFLTCGCSLRHPEGKTEGFLCVFFLPSRRGGEGNALKRTERLFSAVHRRFYL